jgi:hypothetical protein
VAQDAPVVLVPHRAVYDLALGETRGNSQVAGVRGRILYDFDGNACEGYSLEFRQVSELDTGEGKVSTSDLRSTTWEGADAKSFKFTSQNFVDQNLVDSVDGHAEHDATKTAVDLNKPQHEDARSRRRPGVPDRAHGARDRCGARRQEHSRLSGL